MTIHCAKAGKWKFFAHLRPNVLACIFARCPHISTYSSKLNTRIYRFRFRGFSRGFLGCSGTMPFFLNQRLSAPTFFIPNSGESSSKICRVVCWPAFLNSTALSLKIARGFFGASVDSEFLTYPFCRNQKRRDSLRCIPRRPLNISSNSGALYRPEIHNSAALCLFSLIFLWTWSLGSCLVMKANERVQLKNSCPFVFLTP